MRILLHIHKIDIITEPRYSSLVILINCFTSGEFIRNQRLIVIPSCKGNSLLEFSSLNVSYNMYAHNITIAITFVRLGSGLPSYEMKVRAKGIRENYTQVMLSS